MHFTFIKNEMDLQHWMMESIDSCLSGKVDPGKILIYHNLAYQDPRTYTHQKSDGIHYLKRAIGEYFSNGATIVINDFQDVCPALITATSSTNSEVKANCYISPLNAPGVALHEDPYDVLIVQISGSKKWHLAHWRQRTPSATVTTSPGDIFLMEKGTFHHPITVSGVSIHLTMRGNPLPQPRAMAEHLRGLGETPAPNAESQSYFESLLMFRDNARFSVRPVGSQLAEEKQLLLNLVEKCNGSSAEIQKLLSQSGHGQLLRDLVYADEVRVH